MKPVFASAYRSRKDHKFLGIHLYYTYYNGHAWIIDGYEDQKRRYTYTYRWESVDDNGDHRIPDYSYKSKLTDSPYDGMIETEIFTTSTKYYIMNWGWNGIGDTGRFVPSGSWDGGLGDYRYLRKIICDFNF